MFLCASDAIKSQKRNLSASSETCSGPKKKQVKIAPKIDLGNFFNDSGSQSSWLSNSSLSSSRLNSLASPSLDGSDLRAQLSNLNFDSGIELSTADQDTKPTPKRTTPRKSRRKQKLPSSIKVETETIIDERAVHVDAISNTISIGESGIGDILAGIEKDLSSPAKMLLRTPPQDDLITSTPFKDTLNSPSWISPIRGITPGGGHRNHLSHRDLYTPNTNKTSTPMDAMLGTPDSNVRTPSKIALNTPYSAFEVSPTLKTEASPQLQVFGMNGLTPLKSPFAHHGSSPELGNSSFTRLFGDFHLDNVMMDDPNIDVGNFSFSAFPDEMKTE